MLFIITDIVFIPLFVQFYIILSKIAAIIMIVF